MPDKKSGYKNSLRVFGQIANIGFFFAASILVGLYGGIYLDNYLATNPLFTISGIFLGVGAGFFEFYKIIVKLDEGE